MTFGGSCFARTAVQDSRHVKFGRSRARSRQLWSLRRALVLFVRPRRGRARRRDDPRNDGPPRSPSPVGLRARAARRRRPRPRRFPDRCDSPGDSERASSGRGRHDPGHADRVPARTPSEQRRRSDVRRDERVAVRRDGRRQSRVQLRARRSSQGAERRPPSRGFRRTRARRPTARRRFPSTSSRRSAASGSASSD